MESESGVVNPEEVSQENPLKQPKHHGELPEDVVEITPYERVRKLDIAYENPRSLEALSVSELQEAISNYLAMPEYKQYQELYLNFHGMDAATEKFHDYIKSTDHAKLADDLKGVIKDIKFAVSDYYKSVMAFERTHIQRDRLEASEFMDQMVREDQHRTVMHNRLIDCVVRYTRLVNRVIPEQTDYHFDKAEMFDPNLVIDLRSTDKNLHNPARNRIATWAFYNERGVHIEKAVERAQDLMEKKRAVPE